MNDHKIDDTLLGAFLDRELDAVETARVEQLVADNPELQERLQLMESTDAALRQSFEQLMRDPVPGHIEAAIGPARKSGWSPARLISGLLSPGFAGGFASASVILIAVGLWSGGLFETEGGATPENRLHQALASSPSGVPVTFTTDSGVTEILPVLSFRNTDGEYCRQYEQTIMVSGRTTQASGVACGGGNGWRIAAFAEVASSAGPPASGGDYAPAAGAGDRTIDELAEGWMAGAPFSRADEERLIRDGWRD